MVSAVFASSPVAPGIFSANRSETTERRFPVIRALFSRLFRMPQIPVLSDSQPPECPQDEASDGGGQCQPTAGLPSPPAGSGGDDAAGRADDSRHNGRYVCRCAMFGHPVVAVACEGETKPGQGRCRFCGCLAGIAGCLGIFRNFRGVPEAEVSPCRFPGARGAEQEYLRRRRLLPTQLLSPLPLLRPLVLPTLRLPMALRLFLLLPMALLLSPLVLLRPLVLPTLPVSLLLSLPSCLPIAGASPRSPVRCGECGGGYGVLRSGTAPRRPVAGA